MSSIIGEGHFHELFTVCRKHVQHHWGGGGVTFTSYSLLGGNKSSITGKEGGEGSLSQVIHCLEETRVIYSLKKTRPVSLEEVWRKHIQYSWRRSLARVIYCLGLVPRIFTKLFKIPVDILRRINITVIIYLGNTLSMSQKIEGLNLTRDTLTFLLQQLGFVTNLKKSVLSPTQGMEFLGLEKDSVQMTLTLRETKV